MVVGPNYVYIALPRTGSVAISNWLCEHHGGKRIEALYHRAAIPPQHQPKPVFTVVRHPYSRMSSLYRYVKQNLWPSDEEPGAVWPETREMPLVEFVDWCSKQDHELRPQWASQSRILKPVRDRVLCLRYEQIPFDGFGIPRVNATSYEMVIRGAPEQMAIDSHSLEDFMQFGYTMGTGVK